MPMNYKSILETTIIYKFVGLNMKNKEMIMYTTKIASFRFRIIMITYYCIRDIIYHFLMMDIFVLCCKTSTMWNKLAHKQSNNNI